MYSRIIRIGLSYRSRTGGGGAHTIGNVEARRHGAKEFLVKIILNFSTGGTLLFYCGRNRAGFWLPTFFSSFLTAFACCFICRRTVASEQARTNLLYDNFNASKFTQSSYLIRTFAY